MHKLSRFEKIAEENPAYLDDALVGFKDLMVFCRLGSVYLGLD